MTTKLTTAQIKESFEASVYIGAVKNYIKFRAIDARLADIGEKITTVIGGEIETTNIAAPGQVVAMNKMTKSREQWLIPGQMFRERYANGDSVNENWQEFQSIGTVDAFEWNGESVEFEAPWGELMVMNPGDYLARIPGTEDDIYRIARTEFLDTYRH